MELLYNPAIHSIFASLGSMQGDTYVVNDECMSILEEINCKLAMEDHTLRTYRRAIGFGQNLKKDIIPFLINVKDPQIFDCAVRLMVNLTVPIECLLSVDVMSRTEIGRHTIYELNRLLITSKEAFVDLKATKAVIDRMKNVLETDHKLSPKQCESVNNCLLLLRNILHIPESTQPSHVNTSMQNQILWNLFTQSIDKLLIHLMSCPQKSFWGVTLVQLIALMYKDQHVGTLQKLLNHWFDAGSHSESSEDNESNTSPPKHNTSGDSSPMLTSDPTSDSSDNCSGNMTTMSDPQSTESDRKVTSDYQNTLMRVKPKANVTQKSIDSVQSSISSDASEMMSQQDIIMKSPDHSSSSSLKNSMWTQKSRNQSNANNQKFSNKQKKLGNKQQHLSNSSELSDCGYGTQVSQGDLQAIEKNRESISTSSNDDDSPKQKPAHQKPPTTNQKQRFNAAQKQRNANASTAQEKKDARRKKLVKRSKSSIINMKGLIHHAPTDEDISNILKEFTVDFLLKGYGFLVQELHSKLLTDVQLSIDTSHFFWLVTYFLKFAAQLELDLEHISPVLSFDIVSYLTFEGVNLCEQLELTSRQQGADLKPYLRRIHLVVTAIREFLQALEVYKKSSHLSKEDREYIQKLEVRISRTENLRQLFVLLLRCYNPSLQSRQYLQDLVVTNHILLLLLDNVKETDARSNLNLVEHIRQFATVDIMHQYGILLEDFEDNEDFVNDCIFSMMHHVGGDLNQVAILFQPNILKTYSQIWETEYELCNDWSDLIEYVIHKFINTPPKPKIALPSSVMTDDVSINNIWAQEEMDTLYWNYVQSKKFRDVVGNIISQLKESGHKIKSRIAVIQQLLQQDIISLIEYSELMKFEDSEFEREARTSLSCESPKDESGIEMSDTSELCVITQPDDIKVLRDRLLKENKGQLVLWLQKVLLECCFIKINLKETGTDLNEDNRPIMEPVSHHCILKHQSIPLVPFNSEQNKILVYQPFVLLLHKLGFHLPTDANKLYVRIPEFWTPEIMFEVAEKLGPIQKTTLKFDISRFRSSKQRAMSISPTLIGSEPRSPELDTSDHSLFEIPRSRSTKHMIRCTPEIISPTNQNWFQVVMQSNNLDSERLPIKDLQPSSTEGSQRVHTFLQPSPPIRRTANKRECITSLSDELDSDNFSDCATTVRQGEFCPIPECHELEVIDSYETNSVASSLTRMCVSDGDDKSEISSTSNYL